MKEGRQKGVKTTQRRHLGFLQNLAFLTITQVLSSAYPLMQHTYILTLCPEFSQHSAYPWSSGIPLPGAGGGGGMHGGGAWCDVS